MDELSKEEWLDFEKSNTQAFLLQSISNKAQETMELLAALQEKDGPCGFRMHQGIIHGLKLAFQIVDGYDYKINEEEKEEENE